MPAAESSFISLANVPVHYDRMKKFPYGSKGTPRTFQCRNKLKTKLDQCMEDLFAVWGRNTPSIILTAGTLGDGRLAHGQGYAFDLDGFFWEDNCFMMKDYPIYRNFYIGINAHLFLYFSQVLSYHYPKHKDHFHVDFNFSYRFRPESNAQTFFVQSALRYLFDLDLGKSGIEKDGVDGVYGVDATGPAVEVALAELGLAGQGPLTEPVVWRAFLTGCRTRAFA